MRHSHIYVHHDSIQSSKHQINDKHTISAHGLQGSIITQEKASTKSVKTGKDKY